MRLVWRASSMRAAIPSISAAVGLALAAALASFRVSRSASFSICAGILSRSFADLAHAAISALLIVAKS
jgi:hypothetical protein